MSSASSLSATLFGFIFSALSILGALWNRQLIVNMQKTGHFNELLNNMALAACSAIVVMLWGLASSLIPTNWLYGYFSIMAGGFITCVGFSLTALSRFLLTLKYV